MWQEGAVREFKIGTDRHHCVCAPVSDRARDTHTDEIVALKKVRMDKEKDGELGAGCRTPCMPGASEQEGVEKHRFPGFIVKGLA